MSKEHLLAAAAVQLPDNQELTPIIAIFKAVSDPTRLKILLLIADQAFSVNEIAERLAISQSAISHQLQTLRQLNLVEGVRQGKEIHYRLMDRHIIDMYQLTAKHVRDQQWGAQ